VSPYHLATREAPALCALLLADETVTLIPEPAAGTTREELDDAVQTSPRFLRFMERIRWTVPLWKQGVVSGGLGDERVVESLAGVYDRIASTEALGSLRRAFAAYRAEDERTFLDRVSGDLLKGGPDPAVSIPIHACLDEFAARRAIPVVRATPTSIAQRAEAMLHVRRFTFTVPILTQASGRRILELRSGLEEELGALRAGVTAAIEESGDDSTPLDRDLASAVTEAARGVGAAFERLRPALASGDDDEGRRVMDGYVSVTAVSIPADAVIRSSLHAMRSASLGRGTHTATAEPAARTAPPLLRERLISFIVKPMNIRPGL